MPLADSPFDLETVFREQFTQFVKLLFPDESLSGTSVPQDYSVLRRDECLSDSPVPRMSESRSSLQ